MKMTLLFGVSKWTVTAFVTASSARASLWGGSWDLAVVVIGFEGRLSNHTSCPEVVE
jgi:hypothetical protein